MKNIDCVLRSTLTLYIHTYSELSRNRGRDTAASRNRAERTTGDSYREGKKNTIALDFGSQHQRDRSSGQQGSSIAGQVGEKGMKSPYVTYSGCISSNQLRSREVSSEHCIYHSYHITFYFLEHDVIKLYSKRH